MIEPGPARRFSVIAEAKDGDLFVYMTDDLDRAERMAELMRDGHGNAKLTECPSDGEVLDGGSA